MRFFCNKCIMTWEKCGVSPFTHCITHVEPNYKTILFAKQGNHTHRYMLEPIPLSTIWTIAFIWLSSHALRCATRRWGTSDEWSLSHNLLKTSSGVWVSHFDIVLCLWSYLTMSTHLQENQILAQISLTITMCTLNCNIHLYVKFFNEYHYSLSHVLLEM